MKKRCCNSCRRRHRRCITLNNQDKCNACIEAGADCRYDESVRFKHHSTTTANQSSSSVPAKCKRLVLTKQPSVDNQSIPVVLFVASKTEHLQRRSRRKKQPRQQRQEQVNAHTDAVFDKPSQLPDARQPQNIESPQPAPLQNHRNPGTRLLASQKEPLPRLDYTTELPPFATLDLLTTAPAKDAPASLTQREAFLFKTYIHHLAPSVIHVHAAIINKALLAPRLLTNPPLVRCLR